MDLNRIQQMSFSEMMSDVLEKTKSRLAKDPSSYFSSEMKVKLTSNRLKCLGIFGISYFLSVLCIVCVTSIFFILPVVIDDLSQIRTRYIIASLFIFNIVANFIFMIIKQGFYEGTKTDEALGILPDQTWKKCLDCDHLMPPRTHHCILCGKCVLKRDHHCFFTGTCVGFHNQRYFIVFCFYCGIGTAYALYLNYQFLTMEYLHPTFSNFYHFVLPITFFEWLFGYVSLGFLYYVFHFWLCVCTSMGSCAIFLWQFFLALYGTTTHEFWKGNRSYRMDMRHHLRSVFGSYWALNFIIPMPSLKQTDNGVYWRTAKCM